MSLLQKGQFGLKPRFFRIFNPKLKHGVSVNIVLDKANYLPRPLGRGLNRKLKNEGIKPLFGVHSIHKKQKKL